MRWFQVDTDTSNDDRIRAIVRRVKAERFPGLAAAWVRVAVHGFLLDLWCLTASQAGAREPGFCEIKPGRPYSVESIAEQCHVTAAFAAVVLAAAAAEGHIDQTQWAAGLVYFPGMAKRADEYTKKKLARVNQPTASGQLSVESPAPGPTVSRHKRKNTVNVNVSVPQDRSTDQLLREDQDLGPSQIDQVVMLWNTHTTAPIPKVDPKRLSHDRQAAIQQALKVRANLDDWRRVIVWLDGKFWAKRPGRNPEYKRHHPNWVATFDWFLKPGKLQKLFEQMTAEASTPHTAAAATGGDRSKAKGGKYAELRHGQPEKPSGGSGEGGPGSPGGENPPAASQGDGGDRSAVGTAVH